MTLAYIISKYAKVIILFLNNIVLFNIVLFNILLFNIVSLFRFKS